MPYSQSVIISYFYHAFLLALITGPVITSAIHFVDNPSNVTSTHGILDFTCSVESASPVAVTWYDRGHLIEQNTNVHLKTFREGNITTSDLTLANPLVGYVYQIYCNASDGKGYKISDFAYGAKAFIEPFQESFEERTKISYEGETLTLACKVPNAYPKPTITWFRDGQFMSQSHNSDLILKNLNLIDNGNYHCLAENMAGRVESRPMKVSVYTSADSLASDFPNEIKTKIGSMAKFTCNTLANQIKWRRLDGQIDQMRSEIKDSSLFIKDVRSSDEGSYICEDVNDPYISQKTILIVQSEPEFVITPETVSAVVGQQAILQCKARGNPEPDIYWTNPKKDLLFKDEIDHRKYELLSEGHLRIFNVNESDEGEYQCTATSSLNTRMTKGYLKVKKSTEKSPEVSANEFIQPLDIPPIIRLPPSNLSKTFGEMAMFPCQLDKNFDYTFQISWTKMTNSAGNVTEVISPGHRFVIHTNGTLVIHDVRYEDVGCYTCFVENLSNMALRSNWTAWLTMREPMMHYDRSAEIVLDSPVDLAHQVDDSHVILTWTQPRTYLVEEVSYRIECFNENQIKIGWSLVVDNWNNTQIKVEGLQPKNVYYFIIRPWSRKSGVHGWASPVIGPIKTKPIIVDDHNFMKTIQSIEVIDIKASNIGKNRIRLTWKIQDKFIAYIGGFNVKYREVPLIRCAADLIHDQNQPVGKRKSSETTSDFCSIYQLNLRYNEKPQEVTFVDYLKSNMTIFDPTDDTLESITQKMNVKKENRKSTFEIILQGMKAFSCQEFEIEPFSIDSATYGSIKGRESQSSTILSLEKRPSSAPKGLCIYWMNDTSLSISWDHLQSHEWNGLPISYIVYLTDESSKMGNVLKTEPTENEMIITGIKSAGPFMVNMAAENCLETSVRSENIKFPSFVEASAESKSMKWGCDKSKTLISSPNGKSLFSDYIIRIAVIIAGVVLIFVTVLLCTTFLCCFRKRVDKKDLLSNIYSGPMTYEIDGGKQMVDRNNYHLEPLLQTPLSHHQQQAQRGPMPPSYASPSNISPSRIMQAQSQYPNPFLHLMGGQPQGPQVSYSTYNPMITCQHHDPSLQKHQNYQEIEDYGAPYASTSVIPNIASDPSGHSDLIPNAYQNQYISHSSSSATGEDTLPARMSSKKTNSTRTPSTSSSNGILTQKWQQNIHCVTNNTGSSSSGGGNHRPQQQQQKMFDQIIPPPPNSPPPPCPRQTFPDQYDNKASNYSDLC